MVGFENFAEDARGIELEIERKGVVLGIDWNDEVQVRALACEALDHTARDMKVSTTAPIDPRQMAKIDLFGLAALMLKTMADSAEAGIESHGGAAWKAFSRALRTEVERRRGT